MTVVQTEISARRWYLLLMSLSSLVTSPIATPAAGSFICTPASIRAKVPAHIDAIEEEPETRNQTKLHQFEQNVTVEL